MGLLFVTDKMLNGSDDMLLHANDRLVQQTSCKVRVVAETFPIATSTNDSSKTSAYRSKSHICALALELSSEVFFRLADKGFVPSST